jgi:hypothetical protein
VQFNVTVTKVRGLLRLLCFNDTLSVLGLCVSLLLWCACPDNRVVVACVVLLLQCLHARWTCVGGYALMVSYLFPSFLLLSSQSAS